MRYASFEVRTWKFMWKISAEKIKYIRFCSNFSKSRQRSTFSWKMWSAPIKSLCVCPHVHAWVFLSHLNFRCIQTLYLILITRIYSFPHALKISVHTKFINSDFLKWKKKEHTEVITNGISHFFRSFVRSVSHNHSATHPHFRFVSFLLPHFFASSLP